MTRRQGGAYPLLHIGCFIILVLFKHLDPESSQKRPYQPTSNYMQCLHFLGGHSIFSREKTEKKRRQKNTRLFSVRPRGCNDCHLAGSLATREAQWPQRAILVSISITLVFQKSSSHTLPETNSSHLKIGCAPKGNDRIPTIHFQVLC